MTGSRQRHGYEVALLAALSISALSGCGADDGFSDLGSQERVVTAEQAVIPGSSTFQVTRTLSIPAGGAITDQTVSCPAGSVIVGGGHFIGASSAEVRVHRTHSAGNAWNISAANRSTTQASGLDLYAQCLSGTTATVSERWSTATLVPAAGTASLYVVCPTGTVLAGGGFQAGSDFRPYRNGPVFSGGAVWVVAGVNTSPRQSTTLRVMGVCVGGGVVGIARISGEQTPPIPPSGQIIFHQPACPTGTLLSSGGYSFSSIASPSFARGVRRNNANPAVWTSVLVNKEATQIAPFVHTICLDLLQ
jgi:hypothetical protein